MITIFAFARRRGEINDGGTNCRQHGGANANDRDERERLSAISQIAGLARVTSVVGFVEIALLRMRNEPRHRRANRENTGCDCTYANQGWGAFLGIGFGRRGYSEVRFTTCATVRCRGGFGTCTRGFQVELVVVGRSGIRLEIPGLRFKTLSTRGDAVVPGVNAERQLPASKFVAIDDGAAFARRSLVAQNEVVRFSY